MFYDTSKIWIMTLINCSLILCLWNMVNVSVQYSSWRVIKFNDEVQMTTEVINTRLWYEIKQKCPPKVNVNNLHCMNTRFHIKLIFCIHQICSLTLVMFFSCFRGQMVFWSIGKRDKPTSILASVWNVHVSHSRRASYQLHHDGSLYEIWLNKAL